MFIEIPLPYHISIDLAPTLSTEELSTNIQDENIGNNTLALERKNELEILN